MRNRNQPFNTFIVAYITTINLFLRQRYSFLYINKYTRIRAPVFVLFKEIANYNCQTRTNIFTPYRKRPPVT